MISYLTAFGQTNNRSDFLNPSTSITESLQQLQQRERVEQVRNYRNNALRIIQDQIHLYPGHGIDALRQRINEDQRLGPITDMRAEYLTHRNGAAFNSFLPLRRSLQFRPTELRRYEEMVSLILLEARFNWADMNHRNNDRLDYHYTNLSTVDDATKYFIAAHLVEMLYNRPDILHSILNRSNEHNRLATDELRIVLSRNRPRTAGESLAFYDPRTNTLNLYVTNEGLSFLSNTVSREITHEFGHAIDTDARLRRTTGEVPGLTERQLTEFRRERDRLLGFMNLMHSLLFLKIWNV